MRALAEFFNPENNMAGKTVVGVMTSIGSFGISTLTQFEIWLRITSLLVGILVGVASLVSLVLGIFFKLRQHRGK